MSNARYPAAHAIETDVAANQAAQPSIFEHVIDRLDTKRAPLALAAIATMLSLATLRHGFQADDNVFHTLVNDAEHTPTRLFYFSAKAIAQGVQVGAFPWWSSQDLTFEFLRPLASVMHWFEFRQFPHAPVLMRLIGILIYALTVIVATLAYREILPRSRAALVAALLFAVDDGHAVPAAWISARNTALAALFTVLALLCFLKAKRAGSGARALGFELASAGSAALALASSEAGVWALAYVFAASIALETGNAGQRLRSLTPHLLVAIGWVALFVQRPYGLRGSGWYRSISSPWSVLAQGALDLPLWLAGAFGPGSVDVAASQSQSTARLVAVPIAVVFVSCLIPTVRRSRQTVFFTLGTLGCIVPLLTTIPQDRLLVGASFGAFGLIGSFIADAAARPRTALARYGRRLHLGIHACLAPLLFPIAASNPEIMQRTNHALVEAAAGASDVVLIDSPAEVLGYYAHHMLAASPAAAPRTLHQLYAGRSDLWLERIDERTLDVHAALGWGSTPYETFFAGARALPKKGSRRSVQGVEINVLDTTADGRPTHVRFRFADRLEAEHRRWLTWEGRQPVTWTPPDIGQRKRIAGQPLTDALKL